MVKIAKAIICYMLIAQTKRFIDKYFNRLVRTYFLMNMYNYLYKLYIILNLSKKVKLLIMKKK